MAKPEKPTPESLPETLQPKSGKSWLWEKGLQFRDWVQVKMESDEMKRFIAWLDRSSRFMTQKNYESDNEVLPVIRGPIVVGMWAFLILFIFFGGWAVLAPLESAAVAPGTVVLDSNKKTIQHLEGGIISEILVHEGDRVKAGQALIRLSETNAKARQEILANQMRTAQANEARLLAERDDLEAIPFPEDLLKVKDQPAITELLDTQQRLFESRRAAVKGKVDVFEQRIKQLEDEINGLRAQETAAGEQATLINEEIGTVQQLLDKGQGLRPRLLALKREAAELEGKRGELLAQVARAEQSIGENRLQILNAKNEQHGETIDMLRKVQDEKADLEEKVTASSDILERVVISAPQAGIVTGLRFHTIGGVIAPGAPVMDIVPTDDRLIVEAQVDPKDIDVVHQGLQARVRLSAYKSRKVPPIDGVVQTVSADKFIDQATNRSFFLARVEVDAKMLSKLKDVELYPGMPAEVLIVTGKRSFMSYLMSPITQTFHHAFRED